MAKKSKVSCDDDLGQISLEEMILKTESAIVKKPERLTLLELSQIKVINHLDFQKV